MMRTKATTIATKSVLSSFHKFKATNMKKVYVTAAALTTLSGPYSPSHAYAFQICHPNSAWKHINVKQEVSPQEQTQMRTLHRFQNTSTRLFFSRNSSNKSDKDKSIFDKTADKVKKFVPSFLKPKSSLTKKERAKDEVSSSIDKMLKDAPLGVRMMGKMISPIISSVAGNMAEAMEEQSRQMSDLLSDARMYIVSDSVVIQDLGEPIEVGSPFSQSSSSMNVNGKTTSRINASFEVRGSQGSGIATMDASDGKISQLLLNINGKRVHINVTGMPKQTVSGSSSKKTSRSGGLGKNRIIDAEIIDAEFVEKKVDK